MSDPRMRGVEHDGKWYVPYADGGMVTVPGPAPENWQYTGEYRVPREGDAWTAYEIIAGDWSSDVCSSDLQ